MREDTLDATRLILASGSEARSGMLKAAGLNFEVIPAQIDEEGLTTQAIADNPDISAESVSCLLAAEKARAVSELNPQAIVVGSDQVLALGTRFFSKAKSLAEARDALALLRGETHELVSGVALAKGGDIIWKTSDSAQMTMRDFSDEFLCCYLERIGTRALRSVGCYELEGLGVQLFDQIDGDYFTILGMPLLPLLAQLRTQGLVTA